MRPIDADEFERELLCDMALHGEQLSGDAAYNRALVILAQIPTLPPQNEPLTLISISDELPPDNERVLVYRPCMVDSDIGPYSVQWGWAAKRDGSHWARLPNRFPPEVEEETCAGCVYENNEHEECNYCRRAAYLSDYYYRPPEEEI